MKAISLWQPWASFVAAGVKKIETRSWAYRGSLPVWLAIHATATLEPRVAEMLANTSAGDQLRGWLSDLCGIQHARDLPLGCVVAVARLAAVEPTATLAEKHFVSDLERALGDYRKGRWAWLFDRVEFLERPLPARGAQNVWEWTEPAEVRALLGAGVQTPAPDLFGDCDAKT